MTTTPAIHAAALQLLAPGRGILPGDVARQMRALGQHPPDVVQIRQAMDAMSELRWTGRAYVRREAQS